MADCSLRRPRSSNRRRLETTSSLSSMPPGSAPLKQGFTMNINWTHRQRVLSAMNRTGYDRIPVKHEATPEVNKMLMEHFGLSNMEQLLRVVGDDFRSVEPADCGPARR